MYYFKKFTLLLYFLLTVLLIVCVFFLLYNLCLIYCCSTYQFKNQTCHVILHVPLFHVQQHLLLNFNCWNIFNKPRNQCLYDKGFIQLHVHVHVSSLIEKGTYARKFNWLYYIWNHCPPPTSLVSLCSSCQSYWTHD